MSQKLEQRFIKAVRAYGSRMVLAKEKPRLYKWLCARPEYFDKVLPSKLSSYTNEDLVNIAKKYKYRKEWYAKDVNSYIAACTRGILDQCCAHMKTLRNTYTNKDLFEIAKKYKFRNEWQKKDRNSYASAQTKGILDQCCAHMEIKRKMYTDEDLLKVSKKYMYRNEWRIKDANSYSAAIRRGLLDQCCAHMEIKRKTYTDEDLFKIAKKYKSRKEWEVKDLNSYASARYRKIYKQCCAHMGVNKRFRSVYCFETKKTYESLSKAAKKLNISREAIYLQIKGKQKTVGGYTFKYAED